MLCCRTRAQLLCRAAISYHGGRSRSSLETCNQLKSISVKPGASPFTGLFSNPLLASPEGLLHAARATKQESEAVVEEILLTQDPEQIVFLFDELSDALCRTADAAECLRLVHPNRRYVEYAGECCTAIGSHVEELNTHRGLHQALKHVTTHESFVNSQDEVMKSHVSSLMHDFEISGIHLSDGVRERVVQLNGEILSLSHMFVRNCTQPVELEKSLCPQFLIDAYPSNGDRVLITHVPYNSPDPMLRSAGYLLYHSVIPQQVELLESLLSLRHELATLVGYPTFAHRSLKTTTAQSPEQVLEFLYSLSEKILPLAKEEVQDMLKIKQELGDVTDKDTVRQWDVTYLMGVAQQKRFPQLQDRALASFFSLDSCIAVISNLFCSLFDVSLRPVRTLPGETWHPSVRKYTVTTSSGEVIGTLYCDFFSRSGKIANECQFTIQGGRRRRDGSYQLPVVVLCLSLPGSDPVYLTQQAAENLFHEMGHAIHSVLGRSKYQNVSGTRCATDFAEVPSNLMEMFLRDSRVLSSFAQNPAHQPIPSDLQSMLQCSTNMYPAFNAQTQILYAVMDQLFHVEHPLTSTTRLFADLSDRLSPIPHPPETAWFLRFNHMYSYAAKYYSYPWAHATASLIWKHGFSADPFSAKMGSRLKHMLSFGGGHPPRKLVERLLGFSPSVSDLVDAYVSDIARQKEKLLQYKS